ASPCCPNTCGSFHWSLTSPSHSLGEGPPPWSPLATPMPATPTTSAVSVPATTVQRRVGTIIPSPPVPHPPRRWPPGLPPPVGGRPDTTHKRPTTGGRSWVVTLPTANRRVGPAG